MSVCSTLKTAGWNSLHQSERKAVASSSPFEIASSRASSRAVNDVFTYCSRRAEGDVSSAVTSSPLWFGRRERPTMVTYPRSCSALRMLAYVDGRPMPSASR